MKLLSVLVSFVLFLPAAVSAAEEKPPGDDRKAAPEAAVGDKVANPFELHDPAFARFIDISLIGPAIVDRDATLLADLGLQMAEGERVLQRTHKSGATAATLLEKAAALAADTQDQSQLQRLSKAAAMLKDKDLSTRLAALEKLGGKSRTGTPDETVSLADVDVDNIIELKHVLDSIGRAELTGDSELLAAVESDLNESNLSEAQRRMLAVKIESAKKELAAIVDGTPAAALAKLTAASRAGDSNIYNRTSFDLWVAEGWNKDNSIAGLGNMGHPDPNPYIAGSGWKKLPAGGQLDVGYHKVHIAAINNGQWKSIRPSKDVGYDAQFFPFSRKGFDAQVPYGSPGSMGGDSNARREKAIKARGYGIATFYSRSSFAPRYDQPAVIGGAMAQELQQWFLQTAQPSDFSVLKVTNASGRKLLFKVRFRTSSGNESSFSDYKDISSGSVAEWRLGTGNGDFQYANGRVAVGIDAVDPFSNQHYYWGLDNNNITGLNASQQKKLSGNKYYYEYSGRVTSQ